MDPNQPDEYPNRYPLVVLLGDSLTQHAFDEEGNFGGRLQSLLQCKADVINRGFSGYNTEFLKMTLPLLFNEETYQKIACLTLCIGANDSWFPTDTRFNPCLPIERYKENLVEMIEFLLNNGLAREKILLITPPTYQSERYVAFCRQNNVIPTDKTAEHTRRYAEAMIDVGHRFGIRVFDAFELTDREEHRDRAFVDGLHFSEYGAQLLYDLIKNDVEQLVNEYRGTDRPNFPTYLDLDFNRPETFWAATPESSSQP